MAKIASHPIDLFDTGRFKNAITAYGSHAYIGHNRFATTGAKNSVNAHPFHFGNIVGAHNGTLETKSWRALEEAVGENSDVDSAAIFKAFDVIGVEETIGLLEKGRTSSTGAWALTWIDLEDGTLNLLRNAHRPLWYAHSSTFDKMFWASEWPMIDAAIRMSSDPGQLHRSDKGHSFWELKEDTWYKIPLADLALGSVEKPDYRYKELAGKEPSPVVTIPARTTPFVPGNYSTTTSMTPSTHSRTSPLTTRGAGKPVQDVIDVPVSAAEPFAGHLEDEYLLGLSQYGCSWCGEDIILDSPGISIFMQDDKILGPCCTNHPKKNRVLITSGELDEVSKKVEAYG